MADELGVDDNPYRVAFAQFVVVGNTDAEAEKLYAEHIEYSLGNGIGYIPFHRLALPGGISPQGLRALLQQMGAPQGSVARKYKDIVESGAVVAGSAATVRDRLTELAQNFRIGNLLVFLQVGSMPHALAKYNIDMFASGVLPHLRELWPEYAAQNRWWPTRLGGLPVSSKQADPSGGRLK
jgi:alkanesulfonate monooxygenase SsuD/methylene tetrahydromethanopterin reductase-like flavin-dependent oxidoreductase (luciferase family)